MYAIMQTRYFYGPRVESTLVVEPQGGYPLAFDTRKEAAAWVSAQDAEIYHEAHNESGRPTYQVVRVGGTEYRLAAKRTFGGLVEFPRNYEPAAR